MDGELLSIFFISETSRDIKKSTGPIYLKFWHKFLLMSTTEIQK